MFELLLMSAHAYWKLQSLLIFVMILVGFWLCLLISDCYKVIDILFYPNGLYYSYCDQILHDYVIPGLIW